MGFSKIPSSGSVTGCWSPSDGQASARHPRCKVGESYRWALALSKYPGRRAGTFLKRNQRVENVGMESRPGAGAKPACRSARPRSRRSPALPTPEVGRNSFRPERSGVGMNSDPRKRRWRYPLFHRLQRVCDSVSTTRIPDREPHSHTRSGSEFIPTAAFRVARTFVGLKPDTQGMRIGARLWVRL